MNKLKTLFSKIKPESSLSKALIKTTLVVLAAVLALFIAIVKPALTVFIAILALIGFFILQVFKVFYEIENNKSRRR